MFDTVLDKENQNNPEVENVYITLLSINKLAAEQHGGLIPK